MFRTAIAVIILVLGFAASISSFSAFAEVVSPSTRFSCYSIRDLQSALNSVVNEQQVYNANTGSDVWTNRSGCQIQYPGRTFIYKSNNACEAGIWGCKNVGFWGWLKTDKFLVEVWRTGHPEESLSFRGREKNLVDSIAWTVGKMYRLSDVTLDHMCWKRVHFEKGVPIYGHQLGIGNARDSRQAKYCAQPPRYKSDRSEYRHRHNQEERDLPLTREQILIERYR